MAYVKLEERRYLAAPTIRQFYRRSVCLNGDHVTPLPYELKFRSGKSNRKVQTPARPLPADVANVGLTVSTAARQACINRAYSEFRGDALEANAQLLATFAEWDESLKLIAEAMNFARQSWLNFRKGRIFKRIAKSLKKDGLHLGSGGWLRYWFGYAPLVGDVMSAVDVIESDVSASTATGSSFEAVDSTRYQYGENWTELGRFLIKMAGDVEVTNPNLALWNRLGLVNVLGTVWEVVPLSFLADWVFDVGSWINGFTDFLGCRIDNPYTTQFLTGKLSSTNGVYPQLWQDIDVVDMVRSATILKPIPNWNALGNLGASVTRAATATALLHKALTGLDGPVRL